MDGGAATLAIWTHVRADGTGGALAVDSTDRGAILHYAPLTIATWILADLPNGWLVNTGAHTYHVARVDHDATPHRLRVSTAEVEPRRGDVAAVVGKQVLIYRPADDALHAVRQPSIPSLTTAYVTPAGALVVAGHSGDEALWGRYDHGRWRQGSWPAGATIGAAGARGNHIAVTLGGPGVDGTPMAGLVISDDGGQTWRQVGVPVGTKDANSVAVTDDGTAFVTTGNGTGPLLRVRPNRGTQAVSSLRPVLVQAVANRLYALATSGPNWSKAQVMVSTDQGHSWTPNTLPGLGR